LLLYGNPIFAATLDYKLSRASKWLKNTKIPLTRPTMARWLLRLKPLTTSRQGQVDFSRFFAQLTQGGPPGPPFVKKTTNC